MTTTKQLVYLATLVVTLLTGAAQAKAWGVCGRGSWVRPPDTVWGNPSSFGAVSKCNCSNITASAQSSAIDDPNGTQGIVWATGNRDGGGGVEWETTDPYGNRTFVPFIWSSNNVWEYEALTIGSGFYTGHRIYKPFWSLNNSYSGRYRVVCITNYPDFTATMSPVPPDPWMLD
jgi:hypothetical protein